MMEQTPGRASPIIVFAATAILVVGLDLWSKAAVFEFLRVDSVGDPPRVQRQVEYEVIPGFFDLQANYNYGAFSGWFSRHTGWLAGLSLVALVALGLFFAVQFRGKARPTLAFTVALALLWGGTAGNLYDRALLGAVRDWIKWYVVWDGKEKVWPNFNVADASICVGVGLWILLEIVRGARERRGAKERPTSTGEQAGG
jgi:signal peptidase II